MQLTNEEKAIVDSNESHVSVTLSFPNHEISDITNDQIYLESMSLDESLLDSDSLVFGKCNGAVFKIKVADFDEDIKNAEMHVTLNYENEELGNLELQFGKYIVNSAERTSDRRFRTITAYDFMSKFDVDIADWYNNTLFPSIKETTDLGWKIEDDGISLEASYIQDGVPGTSTNEYDIDALYVDSQNGYGYIGIGIYNEETSEFDHVEWVKTYEFERNILETQVCNVRHSINEIVEMLCNHIGVEYDKDYTFVNGEVLIEKCIEPADLKGRNFLEQICESNGVFGHFNNQGILTFIQPKYESYIDSNNTLHVNDPFFVKEGSKYSINDKFFRSYSKDKEQVQIELESGSLISAYKECVFEDYDVESVNTLQIRNSKDEIGIIVSKVEENQNEYIITGNTLLYGISNKEELKQIANNILDLISNAHYRPNKTVFERGLYNELGTTLQINARVVKGTETEEITFSTIVLNRTLSGIQSITSIVESKGKQYQDGTNKSVADSINILNSQSRDIDELLTALKANFDSLNAKAITTNTIEANVGKFGYLKADSAIIKSLQTDKLDADTASVTYATITSLNATDGKINTLMAKAITTDNLNSSVANLGYLTADSAIIKGKLDANQLSVEVAKLGYLDADMANIDFANLNKSNIGQLFANVGLLTSATIKDGHVTGYLDSVSVNANNITAGTLVADRILLKDANGNYIGFTVDGSKVVAADIDAANLIKDRTVTADHLVAGTITANEINMTNLVGNSAFINAISTNSVVVTASSNASNALSTANSASSTASSANTKAQGIINNIYTANTTTIDGGKITAGSIKADKIDVNDLFAQNINATGSINGIRIKTDTDTSTNQYATLDGVDGLHIYKGSTSFANLLTDNLKIQSGYSRVTVSPNEISFMSNNPGVKTKIEQTQIDTTTLKENGTKLEDKYASVSSVSTLNNDLNALAYGEHSGSNNLFDEIYDGISADAIYYPIYVGDGSFTLSTTCPLEQGLAGLFLLAGNVNSGISTGGNGVYEGNPITVQSVGGYVTVAYRTYGTVNPKSYKTILNIGSEPLTYEPYVMSNKQLGKLNNSLIDLKMLGWSVPEECPIQNSVSGNQFIQRVGRIALSSIDYSYTSDRYVYSNLNPQAKDVQNDKIPNLYCEKYSSATALEIANKSKDKVITASNSTIWVRDTSLGSNGKPSGYLYYELATPITMQIDGNEAVERLNTSLGEYNVNTLLTSSYSTTKGFAIDSLKVGSATIGKYVFSFDIVGSATTEVALGTTSSKKDIIDVAKVFSTGHYEYEVNISSNTDLYMVCYSQGAITISNIKIVLKDIAKEVGGLKADLTSLVKIVSNVQDDISISANGNSSTFAAITAPTGYTAISCNYNIANATNGGTNASVCQPFKMQKDGYCTIHNNSSSAAKIKITRTVTFMLSSCVTTQ